MTTHSTERNEDNWKYGENSQNRDTERERGKSSWKNGTDSLAPGPPPIFNSSKLHESRAQGKEASPHPAGFLTHAGRAPPAAGTSPSPLLRPSLPYPFLLASECHGPLMAALNAPHPPTVHKWASTPAHGPGRQTDSPKRVLRNSPWISNKRLTRQSNTDLLIGPTNWLLSREPRLSLPGQW